MFTAKGVLSEKDLLGKAATTKRFYSLLGKELKAQIDIAKEQYKFFKD